MNRLHLRLTSDSGVKTGFFFTPRPNMGEIQNKSTIKRSGLVSLKHCLYFKKKKKKKVGMCQWHVATLSERQAEKIKPLSPTHTHTQSSV